MDLTPPDFLIFHLEWGVSSRELWLAEHSERDTVSLPSLGLTSKAASFHLPCWKFLALNPEPPIRNLGTLGLLRCEEASHVERSCVGASANLVLRLWADSTGAFRYFQPKELSPHRFECLQLRPHTSRSRYSPACCVQFEFLKHRIHKENKICLKLLSFGVICYVINSNCNNFQALRAGSANHSPWAKPGLRPAFVNKV